MLAERAAEQFGEAAASLHDQQARTARKGKIKRATQDHGDQGEEGQSQEKGANGAGHRAKDSLWTDPDETPRHILVCLFDGSRSGGSTPMYDSSEEEPNTDDRHFMKGDDESESDPPYRPTDEEEEMGEESNQEEDMNDLPTGMVIRCVCPRRMVGVDRRVTRLPTSLGTGADRGQPTHRRKGKT